MKRRALASILTVATAAAPAPARSSGATNSSAFYVPGKYTEKDGKWTAQLNSAEVHKGLENRKRLATEYSSSGATKNEADQDGSMPYTVWTLRAFIASIPKELDEAAMADGCTRWQTFYKVILPLTGPGLVATGVYCWILAWNEFVVANTLLLDNNKQTLMVYLLQLQASSTHGADYAGLMAAATLTALPVVVLFVIFQRRIAAGLTAGAVKG